MFDNIDLSQEFHPVPKPLKKVKMPKVMKKIGKKTTRWTDIREELKAAFYKAGIINCELRLKGCWRNTALGFAHLEKRRKLNEDDLYSVVLACDPCHQVVEPMKPEKMKSILEGIIKARKVQPILVKDKLSQL